MLRRPLRWLFARHIEADTARLVQCHGPDAIFVVRHAILAAREQDSGGHWTRVLAQVEHRVRYRPW